MIALIDRLAAYAAREAENESPEERAREEEVQAKRLLGQVRQQRERVRLEKEAKEMRDKFGTTSIEGAVQEEEETEGWGAAVNVKPPGEEEEEDKRLELGDGKIEGVEPRAIGDGTGRKFRGIPEDVKLFEVFWSQVVNLIKVSFGSLLHLSLSTLETDVDVSEDPQARPDLSIQDVTALLVSLANLSLSCYPSHLNYIDQVLSFALSQSLASSDSPDLHHPTTTSHLLSLLLSPIQNYLTVLTLLALPSYAQLLRSQPYNTRRSIAHAIVANVLRNETVIDTSEDVEGILELCHVLVKDQKDRPTSGRAGVGGPPGGGAQGMDRSLSGGGGGGYVPQYGQGNGYSLRNQGMLGGGGGGGGQGYDREEMAEEQGWIARMVHLFKSDDLDTQFLVRSLSLSLSHTHPRAQTNACE